MMLKDLIFTLTPPADWEMRLQVTIIAPAAPVLDLPAMTQTPSPRANVVVSRMRATTESVLQACREFLSQTASAVPGLQQQEIDETFTFNDGTKGVAVEVSFSATPQVKLAQVHAFRLDRGVLAQLVGTWAIPDSEGQRRMLLDLIKKFTP